MFVSVSSVANEPGHSASIYIIKIRWKVTYLKVLPLLCTDVVNIRWEVTYTRVHSLLCYSSTFWYNLHMTQKITFNPSNYLLILDVVFTQVLFS